MMQLDPSLEQVKIILYLTYTHVAIASVYQVRPVTQHGLFVLSFNLNITIKAQTPWGQGSNKLFATRRVAVGAGKHLGLSQFRLLSIVGYLTKQHDSARITFRKKMGASMILCVGEQERLHRKKTELLPPAGRAALKSDPLAEVLIFWCSFLPIKLPSFRYSLIKLQKMCCKNYFSVATAIHFDSPVSLVRLKLHPATKR